MNSVMKHHMLFRGCRVKVFHQHCHQVQIADKCFYVVKEEDIEDEENDASSKHGRCDILYTGHCST